jgi:hypothetical protein
VVPDLATVITFSQRYSYAPNMDPNNPDQPIQEPSTQIPQNSPNMPVLQDAHMGTTQEVQQGFQTRVESRSIPRSDDPDPPDMTATDTAGRRRIAEYTKNLSEFSDAMLAVFESQKYIRGKILWADFALTFRPSAIEYLPTTSLLRWRSFLLKRDVYVPFQREMSRREALIGVLTAVSWPRIPEDKRNDLRELLRDEEVDQNETTLTPAPKADEQSEVLNADETAVRVSEKPQITSNDSDKNIGTIRGIGSRRPLGPTSNRPDMNSHGMAQVAKQFQSREKFTGGFDEDLFGALQKFETFCEMSGLSAREMSASLPNMLDGDALVFYSANIPIDAPYEQKIKMLQDEYTSEEQRNRLLRIWQRTSLLNEMRNNPGKSQLDVFKIVHRNLTKTQRQLHEEYHLDRFLRDQLVLSADLPHLQRSFRENVATSAHNATQRIASLLSSEPGSTSGTAGNIVFDEGDDAANYGLGRRFGGEASKNVQRHSSNHARKGHRQQGCWVCGQDHYAREKHSRAEIKEALSKLKKTRAFVSAASVADVYNTLCSEDDATDDQDTEVDSANLALVNRTNELSFACSSFAEHRGIHAKNICVALAAYDDKTDNFRGLLVDTGANNRSTMCVDQYRTYCRSFGIPMNIKPSHRHLKGIGGRVKSIGNSTLPIPFPGLGVIIDIEFITHSWERRSLAFFSQGHEDESTWDIYSEWIRPSWGVEAEIGNGEWVLDSQLVA